MTVYTCETHQTAHFKMVNFSVYNLDIHKPDFLKSHIREEAGPFLPSGKHLQHLCEAALAAWYHGGEPT